MHCLVCSVQLTGKKTHFCSTKCKSRAHQHNSYPAQQARAKLRKSVLIDKMGGCCSVCGYKKNYAALEFHHKDPSTKKFNLDSRSLSNRKESRIEKEAKKCILICSNCHRELHNPDLSI
jgi:predicted HNH restriction endonuclease